MIATQPTTDYNRTANPSAHASVSLAAQALDPDILARPPRRRAATSARYNLTAAWSPLNDYLSDSSGKDIPGDEDGKMEHTDHDRNGNTRYLSWVRSNIASDDDSDSDEYKDDGEAEEDPPPWGSKRKWANEDRMENTRPKRRKRFRRSRASSKLGFSKDEVQRLANFLLVKTDWQDAARHVFAEPGASKTQSRSGWDESECKPDLYIVEPKDTDRVTRLTKLWADVLSKQIVNLYKL